jgi:hypothetical protein
MAYSDYKYRLVQYQAPQISICRTQAYLFGEIACVHREATLCVDTWFRNAHAGLPLQNARGPSSLEGKLACC